MAKRYCFNTCKKDKPKNATVEFELNSSEDPNPPVCDMLTCEETAELRVSVMVE